MGDAGIVLLVVMEYFVKNIGTPSIITSKNASLKKNNIHLSV